MWADNGQNNKKTKSNNCGGGNSAGQNVEIKVKLVKNTEAAKVELVRNYIINN